MKKRNRELYEHIMNGIARQVRKVINESDEFMDIVNNDLDNLEQIHQLHKRPGQFNRNRKYRGIDGTIYVPGGPHGDPYIVYKGQKLNYYDVEDYMWNEYEYTCDEFGMVPNAEDYEEWINNISMETKIEYLNSYIDR